MLRGMCANSGRSYSHGSAPFKADILAWWRYQIDQQIECCRISAETTLVLSFVQTSHKSGLPVGQCCESPSKPQLRIDTSTQLTDRKRAVSGASICNAMHVQNGLYSNTYVTLYVIYSTSYLKILSVRSKDKCSNSIKDMRYISLASDRFQHNVKLVCKKLGGCRTVLVWITLCVKEEAYMN